MNQGRQGYLSLEELWVNHNAYFRFFTSMVGMTITDNWYLNERFPAPTTIKRKRIILFEDKMVNLLLEYAAALREQTIIPGEHSNLASPVMHTKHFNTTGQRRCLWCFRVCAKISKTKMHCIQCNSGFCDPRTTGRHCWALYLERGGPPRRGYVCKPTH